MVLRPSIKTLIGAMEYALLGLCVALCLFVLFVGSQSTSYANIHSDRNVQTINQVSQKVSETLNIPSGFDPFFRQSSGVDEASKIVKRQHSAKDTGLNLTLKGVITGVSAIIQSDAGQRSYDINEAIRSRVILREVHKDYVLIDNHGKLERLGFEKLPEGEEVSEEIVEEALPEEPVITAGEDKIDRWIDFKDDRWSAETIVKKEEFDVEDSEPVLTQDFNRSVALNLVQNEDGKTAGYKISLTNRNFDLAQTGFQDGDVIIKVGRKDVRKGRTSFGQVFTELSRRDKRTFTVLRAGEEVKLRVGAPSN